MKAHMHQRGISICALSLASVVPFGACARSGVSFQIVNESAEPRSAVVRVSLPVPPGVVREPVPQSVVVAGQGRPVQARAVTHWPDASVRRVLLRLPVDMAAASHVKGVYPGAAITPAPVSAFKRKAPRNGRFRAQLYDLRLMDDRVSLVAQGTESTLAEIAPYGPALTDAQEPTWSVLEEGPSFLWLRCRREAVDCAREVDIRLDSTGDVRVTHRLQSRLRKNEWTPDFGVTAVMPGARSAATGALPTGFLGRDAQRAFTETTDLSTGCVLANGVQVAIAAPLALRQRRGTLALEELPAGTGGGGMRVRVSRLEPVTEENERLMIQDGQWRVTELRLSPCSPVELAQRLDCPVRACADWQAYDAVYHTGQPLRTTRPALREMVETAILYLWRLSIDGDDWGNMTFYDPRADKAQIRSFVRFNHCMYVWHDAFRTGDPRLLRIARDWAENYRNLSVYWGHESKYYGGSRRGQAYREKKGLGQGPGTYMVRFDYALGFVTKGFHNFWLAYEETGDPRFRDAAEAQVAWAMEHVFCNRGEMRNVGAVADFAKLYEYTGRADYLDHAVRLWQEFQSKQMPDLMFTQSGREATGNDLYIPDDAFGYQHPFYKPYITQYATNALPYLLTFRPEDTRLRDTILACNRWMAGVQSAGGGWGYPGPSTAGLSFSPEYCHGMMLANDLEPAGELLDATARTLRSMAQLYAHHRVIPSGLNPWEHTQGQSQLLQTYRLATDRDRSKDFTHGQVRFGTSPDFAAYTTVLLRDYLRHRDEASLFTPDPIVDAMLKLPPPGGGVSGRLHHPWANAGMTHTLTREGMRVSLDARAIYPCLALRAEWITDDGRTLTGPTAAWTVGRRGEYEVALSLRREGVSISRTLHVRTPVGPQDLGWEQWPDGIRIQAEEPAGQGGMENPVRYWFDRKGADGGAFSHWDRHGHWLEYRFSVDQPGDYLLLAKYACPHNAARAVTLDMTPLGTLQLPNSGGYTLKTRDDYSVALLADSGSPRTTTLTPGEHVLRLTNTDGRGCNLDYLEWLPAR